MIHFNSQFLQVFWHALPPSEVAPEFLARWSPRLRDWREAFQPEFFTSDSVGNRLALEALRRSPNTRSSFANQTDPNLALYLTRVGMPDDSARARSRAATSGRNPRLPVPAGTKPTPPNPPDLYGSAGDDILVRRTRLTGTTDCEYAWFRTVWMNGGIEQTRAWMKGVVEFYTLYENENEALGGTGLAPFPGRVVFDQEPTLILHGIPIKTEGCSATPRVLSDEEAEIRWQDAVDY